MNVIRESSILDGILHTTTKKVTKLCPAHLLPDSIPPSPQSRLDEDNTQPTPLDENDAQPPNSQSTLDGEIDEVSSRPPTQQGSPTSLLPPPPAEILQPVSTADDLQSIPTVDETQPSPPAPVDDTPSTSGVGPIRSRRRTMESEIHEKYRTIVEEYYSGTSISKAVSKVGMGRTSLYKWRYMAEMKIIDSSHYSYLQQQFPHATKLSSECKLCLTEGDSEYARTA